VFGRFDKVDDRHGWTDQSLALGGYKVDDVAIFKHVSTHQISNHKNLSDNKTQLRLLLRNAQNFNYRSYRSLSRVNIWLCIQWLCRQRYEDPPDTSDRFHNPLSGLALASTFIRGSGGWSILTKVSYIINGRDRNANGGSNDLARTMGTELARSG